MSAWIGQEEEHGGRLVHSDGYYSCESFGLWGEAFEEIQLPNVDLFDPVEISPLLWDQERTQWHFFLCLLHSPESIVEQRSRGH